MSDNLNHREKCYLEVAVQRTLERDYYQREAARLQELADNYQKLYFSRLNTFHKILETAIDAIKEDCAPRNPSGEMDDLINLFQRELGNRPVTH